MKHIQSEIISLIVISLFLMIPCANAFKASEDIDITADSIEYIPAEDRYIGTGSVVVKSRAMTLKADMIDVNRKTQEAEAVGNVYYEDEDAIIKAERAEFNLQTKLGKVYDAEITYKSGKEGINYYASSDNIERVSEKVFMLEDATVSTCEECPRDWSFSGRKVRIEQGESLTAKGVAMKVRDVPVMYIPYLRFPFQKDRELGFLFPEVGGGEKRGFTYRQGFFIPIGQSKDISVYNDLYAKKGWGKGADFRYALDPKTRGELWMYHTNDTDLNKDYIELKGYHNQPLPYGMDGYVRLHTVNHEEYYEEYDSTSEDRFGVEDPYYDLHDLNRREERLQKYLENTVHIHRPFHAGRTYMIGQYRRNLEGSSDILAHPIPEVGQIYYTRSPDPNGIFSYSFEGRGNYFWSERAQRSQRLDLFPTAYINLGRKAAFSQELGLRETVYNLRNPEDDFSRELIESTTSLSTKLYKRYKSFVHIFEPFIKFDYIPSSQEDQTPDYDLIDIRPKTQLLTYELRNVLKGSKVTGWFRLQHGYTLLDNVQSNSLPVVVEATFYSNPFVLDYHTRYSTHEDSVQETQASGTYYIGRNALTVGRLYRRETIGGDKHDQYNFGVISRGLFFNLPLDVGTRVWLDVEGDGVQKVEVKTTYHSQCWSSTLAYDYRDEEFRMLFGINLRGVGSLGLSEL